MRTRHLFVTIVTLAALSVSIGHAHAAAPSNESIAGAWTLNKEASTLGEQPGANGEDGRRGDGEGRGRRRGGGGGGGFGGGFGGGGSGRGFGNQQPQNQEAAQKMRDALRDELQAPDHMTIVSSGTTVIITMMDGRTTRLATDGGKIKDDSTGIERKTRWDAGKLVSEISGLGRGKITETYSADAASKQLRVRVDVDGARKTTQTRVYDLDPR
jgi:hypothetical protein